METDDLGHILHQNMDLVPKSMDVEAQHVIYSRFDGTKRVLTYFEVEARLVFRGKFF